MKTGSPADQIDVFIGYDRKDDGLATQLYDRLHAWDLQVFKDSCSIGEGEDFRKCIEQALDNAKVVIILWTKHSAVNTWVCSEANRARRRGALHQVTVGDVEPPLGFDQTQSSGFKPEDDGLFDESELERFVERIRVFAKIKGPNERIIQPRRIGEDWNCDDLAVGGPVPGTDIFSSFHPCGTSGVFSLMRVETTCGWVKYDLPGAKILHIPFENDPESEKTDDGEIVNSSGTHAKRKKSRRKLTNYLRTKNEVYFINDPVRPYSIQIGGLRSQRTHATPGFIKCNLTSSQLRPLSKSEPAILELFADVLEDEQTLQDLWDNLSAYSADWSLSKEEKQEKIDRIRDLIARNPNAPKGLQKERCLFCRKLFQKEISEPLNKDECGLGAYILPNSFPFGPFFHYIVITEDAVHYWEELTFKHVVGMNLTALRFVKRKRTENQLSQAAGVEYGFNSTVKHLVLGRHSHSSAGASIPHVHKQVWGMAPRTSNLAEQLILVSDAYWRQGIDYQANYIAALEYKGHEKHSYRIWQDDNVVLYVPYGQCSMHEMQAMTKRPVAHLLKLTDQQMASLSIAEYIALRLYSRLGVTSYNHLVLSKLFNDHRAPTFRLVMIFVTREIDLAMSELSMLYVVDKHPWDSCVEIQNAWASIEDDVMEEVKAWSFPGGEEQKEN